MPNYVEPFFGSGAVMFMRPHEPNVETVNDADCYLANFWRAAKEDSAGVAKWMDNPVNEADLLARHKWLIAQQGNGFTDKMKTDPHFYDVKIAGWWVWGICCWIGDGWCRQESNKLPHLGSAGQGINRKLPHLGEQGRGIVNYLESLSTRLRRVRVACGDWTRVLGDSVTFKHGITGIFLDPPYSADECENVYSVESNVANDVRQWAIENGENKLLRIALCGYDTEHEMPSSWKKVHWKRNGGFEGQAKKESKAQKDRFRETIWFSPYCLNNKQETLF